MPPAKPQRIDPPSPAIPSPVSQRRGSRGNSVAAAIGQHTPPPLSAPPDRSIGPAEDAWLQLHAEELIGRLQGWAAELDAREAQLNARISRQESRERQFRLQQQDALTDQAEQQRSIERLKRQLELQVRQLAFRQQGS